MWDKIYIEEEEEEEEEEEKLSIKSHKLYELNGPLM